MVRKNQTLGPTRQQLKIKIKDVLEGSCFDDPNDVIKVLNGPGDSLHVVVVSSKFAGKSLKKKDELIWSELSQHVSPEEWSKVSLIIAATSEEIRHPDAILEFGLEVKGLDEELDRRGIK